MPAPVDTTITITHSNIQTTTKTTTPKDGPDLIAILTVVVPILTFIFGYFGNRWYENLKEKERLKVVKEYFLTLAKQLADFADIQSNTIIEAANRLTTMSQDNAKANVYVELNTQRIKAIPDLDLYKIFVLNSKNSTAENARLLSSLSSLFDAIDEIKSLIGNINVSIVENAQSYYSRYTEANDNLAKEDIRILKMKDDLDNPITLAEFVKLHNIFSDCLSKYKERKEADTMNLDIIGKGYHYYILPFSSQVTEIKQNELTYNTLYYVSMLVSNWEQHLTLIDISAKELSNMAINLKGISRELKFICEHFEE